MSDATSEPDAPPAEIEAAEGYECSRCGERPPLDEYKCRHCGAVPTEHPYPTIGCRCIAAGFVCDACLAAPLDAAALARIRTT